MKMRKFAVVTALVTTALGVAAGSVNAAPVNDDGAVYYKSTTEGKSSIITTDAGSMDVEDGVFKIKAANGTVLAGTDLEFRVDDFEFPIVADISDRKATLTPQFDIEHAAYKPLDAAAKPVDAAGKPVALPFEDTAPWKTPYDREQAAWNRMKDSIATGATLGTLVGGVGGAAVGCILGGAAGVVLTGPITAMLGAPLGAAGGCIAGLLAVGALGTLAGQLLVTAPVAILAAAQYFTTINAPFAPAPAPAAPAAPAPAK
ncbi:hypothetical protein [Nocardia sp. NPDC051570]|uniref:hypothetical protein n=1 Tax=Nocardia sp. NPDC051570 TaxID=3364324 RepID=UPI003791B0FC